MGAAPIVGHFLLPGCMHDCTLEHLLTDASKPTHKVALFPAGQRVVVLGDCQLARLLA